MVTEKKQDPAVSGNADTGGPDASRGDAGRAGATGGDGPATGAGTQSDELVLGRTRTASLFVAAAVALVLALLMLVFVLQNGDQQRLEFLWFDFTLPAGAAMLLAAIVGGLIVASLGLGRVLQLRLAARRHRHADRRSG